MSLSVFVFFLVHVQNSQGNIGQEGGGGKRAKFRVTSHTNRCNNFIKYTVITDLAIM